MSDAGDAHEAAENPENPEHPEVGSLADEAARLLGALSGWAREHVGEAGEGLSGLAAQAAASAHDLDEHLATGSPECTVCPVCRTVHAVRQLSPEVTGHLAAAATSLAQAVSALMATTPGRPEGAPDGPGGAGRPSGVEHIDLTDDWPEDE